MYSENKRKKMETIPGYLVAISASPYSQYIVKWTRKFAMQQKVPWSAVYIQTSRKLSEDENSQLKKNIELVTELGAELFVSLDDDTTDGILRIARQHNISHIVIGKPLGYKHSIFSPDRNIVDSLIKKSGGIDIFVISEQIKQNKNRSLLFGNPFFATDKTPADFLLVTIWLTLLIGINLYLNQYINYLSVGFILLAAVAVIASIYSKGPVLYFASLSAILWNFLFLQPRFTFYIDRLEDLLMFLMYFITAFIIGNLTTRLRIKDSFLRRREKNLEELYRMGRILNESNNLDDLIEKSMKLLKSIFAVHVAIFLRDEDNNLSREVHKESDFSLTANEFNLALWCYKKGKPAGNGTEMFSNSEYYFFPMLTQSTPAGVLVIDKNQDNGFTIEQENLFVSLVSQITIAVERSEYNRTWQRIRLAEESEKIYQILLNSVSHELKTPITTISTAANGLIDENLGEKPEVRKIFANDIVEASERLNRIVDNLLGSIRIESNKSILNLEWYDIGELVAVVQKKTGRMIEQHDFQLKIDNSLPLLKFDFMLMDHLLTNLLYNAILYTPKDSIIRLCIFMEKENTVISVSDSGPGIPEREREKIFRKFYRSKGVKTGGLGLGLTICREITEIHGGTIIVEKSDMGGAAFIVRIPLQRSEIVKGEL